MDQVDGVPEEDAEERLVDGREAPLRVGVVATDPMRIAGLQAILHAVKEGRLAGALVVPLSIPGMLNDAGLRLVIVDANCTGHLLELLTTFSKVRPLVRLIVLGSRDEPAYIQEVVGAGAKGYLTHGATQGEILMAIEIVHDGSIWAPRKVISRLLDASTRSTPAKAAVRFTERELEVLRLLVTGLGNREIAKSLQIDESTVKAHLSRLMRKVGAKNRIELTMDALRYDLRMGTER